MSIRRIFLLFVILYGTLLIGCTSLETVEPVAEVDVGQTAPALVTVTSIPAATGYPGPLPTAIGTGYPAPEPTATFGPTPTPDTPHTLEPSPTVPPLPTLIPTPEVTPIPTAEPPFIPLPPDQEPQPFSILHAEGSVIWAIDSSGGVPYPLVDVQDALSLYVAPQSAARDWGAASPDGTMLAVVLSSQETYNPNEDSYPEISLYLYHVQQQTWDKVADNGLEPVWSPDSTKLAYRGPEGGLWVTDVVTSESREIYAVDRENGHFATEFSWAPDSQRLVFLDSVPQDSEDVVVVDVSKPENAMVILPDDPYWVYLPRWSPISERIFYVSSAGVRSGSENTNNLWVINSDGNGATQVTQDLEVLAGGSPNWWPNGEWIAVAGIRRYEEENRNVDLWLLSVDGAGLKRLSNTPKFDELFPRWLSDAAHLLFQRADPSGDGNVWSLWFMNLYDGNETELATSSVRDIVILPRS